MQTAFVPLIKVRDRHSGQIKIVGLDSHDTLYITEEGHLSYRNLQNSDCTGKETDAGYEFVNGPINDYLELPYIEFVSLEDLLTIYKNETEFTEEDFTIYLDMAAAIKKSSALRRKAREQSGISVFD